MTETQPTLITSVQRALAVVELVAASSRPLTAKAISRKTGLSLGTTYNLIRTLVHENYLIADRDGLVLGSRFPGMADRPEGVLVARGRAVLNQVCRDLKVAAYLTVYQDGEIRLVDVVDTPESPRVELWVGIQDSGHATAFGKQILAELPPDDRIDYLHRHPLPELTPYTVTDRRELLRRLSRPADAVIDRQEYVLGQRCIAVPVRTPALVGSLAVSLPADRPTADDVLAGCLRDSAAGLSRQLGLGQFSI